MKTHNLSYLTAISERIPHKMRRHLKNFWLVGSRARGDFGDHSDVDILIQSDSTVRQFAKKLRPALPIGDRVDTLATYFRNYKNQFSCEYAKTFHFVVAKPGEEKLFPERILLN